MQAYGTYESYKIPVVSTIKEYKFFVIRMNLDWFFHHSYYNKGTTGHKKNYLKAPAYEIS